MSKFSYASGLPGYGNSGRDGSVGLAGLAIYFCSYDGESDTISIRAKIVSNKILSTTDEYLAGYPTRIYMEGDQFIDRNGKVYVIDFDEISLYKATGQQLNTSGFFEIGPNTVNTPIYTRYSNAFSTSKFLIDIVYTGTAIGNYAANPSRTDGSIYGIGAIDFAQVKYVDTNINNYNPFTVFTSSTDITHPERSIAIVKENSRNTWHIGNKNRGGTLRDVSLYLDFKDIYTSGKFKSIDDVSLLSDLYVGATSLLVGRTIMKNDVSIFGKLDVSSNIKTSKGLTVKGDTSISGNLYGDDVSLYGSEVISNNLKTGGSITSSNNIISNGNMTCGGGLGVSGDVSINGNLKATFINATDDVSILGNLRCSGDVSINGVINSYLRITKDVSLSGIINSYLRVTKDVSLSGTNTIVSNKLNAGVLTVLDDTSINGIMYCNNYLRVTNDASIVGNLYTRYVFPSSNNTYDLGSVTNQFRSIFSDGSIVCDFISLDGDIEFDTGSNKSIIMKRPVTLESTYQLSILGQDSNNFSTNNGGGIYVKAGDGSTSGPGSANGGFITILGGQGTYLNTSTEHGGDVSIMGGKTKGSGGYGGNVYLSGDKSSAYDGNVIIDSGVIVTGLTASRMVVTNAYKALTSGSSLPTDRGNATTSDFTSFTYDANWHTLDLTPKGVPTYATFAILRLGGRSSGSYSSIYFRKYGNTDTFYNVAPFISKDSVNTDAAQVIVGLSSGRIEYKNNGADNFSSLYATVCGWF